MSPVPFDLPVRAPEAAALADLIFDGTGRQPLDDDLRNRLAQRGAGLGFRNLSPRFGSLERDPVHPSVFYIAVDGAGNAPLLLHVASASSPASGFFPNAVLITRTRQPGRHREMVVNAIPFGPADGENIRKYARHVNRAFLPSSQGTRPAVACGLPAPFGTWSAILKKTGVNLASVIAETPAEYDAALWAAIRAGWRAGYTVGPDRISLAGDSPEAAARSMEAAKAAIRRHAACTRFAIDVSELRLPEGALPAAARLWALKEFGRSFVVGGITCEFTAGDVRRMAARFGPGLLRAEELHRAIREAKAADLHHRHFDFEWMLDREASPTTADELFFCLHWLKARGYPAQLAAPNLGLDRARTAELAGRVRALAAVARYLQAALTVTGHPGRQATEAAETVARAAMGRLHYRAHAGEIERVAEVLLHPPV